MSANDMIIEKRPIASLKPHPSNYRKHPPEQIAMLRESIRSHGQQKTVVVMPDGLILAGHGFVEAAKAENWAEVTCNVYTGTRPESFLVIDNVTSNLAVDDMAMLDALLRDIAVKDGTLEGSGFDDSLIDELLAETAAAPEPEKKPTRTARDTDSDEDDTDEDDDADDQRELTRADVPDALFASDNEWGVPVLDVRYQATSIVQPVTKWGTMARHNIRMDGTWHFYTDDYKFDALFKDPTPVVNSGCLNACEINVSTHPAAPRAMALYGIYMKRWLARYWQSKGVRVLVDMNVEPEFNDLNMLGVPKGWKAYVTRGYSQRPDDIDIILEQYRLACERAGTDEILFWLYGGGQRVKAVAAEHQWVWVQEHLQEVEQKRKRYGLIP